MLEQFMTPGGYTCGEMVKQEDGTVLVFSGETRACFDGARGCCGAPPFTRLWS